MAVAEDLLIVDGDYVLDDDGSFQTTPTAASAVRHALLDEYNRWPADPDAGNELYLFIRGANTEAQLDRARDACRVALAPLEAAGRIADTQIEKSRDPNGRWYLSLSSRDTGSGQELTLDPLSEFGG